MKDERVTLPGLTFSGVLLILLGGLFGFYVPFYSVMLCVIIIKSHKVHQSLIGQHPSLLSLVLTIVGTAALCYICVKAGLSLLRSKRWASFVAMGFGLLLFLFGGMIFRSLYLPYAPGAIQGEDFFEFLIALPCVVMGLWWCIYLNLPHVRRQLRNSAVAQPSIEA